MSVITQGVTQMILPEACDGQRVDNYLFKHWKKVPRSKIYKLIRTGQVRMDNKRVKASTKLFAGATLRLPPIYYEASDSPTQKLSPRVTQELESAVLYEDAQLLVLNKPAGWAVHGGSGVKMGLIEAIRQARPDEHSLELVHRLDRETSGCLVIAKKNAVLRALHQAFREKTVEKTYIALVHGHWPRRKSWVKTPLRRYTASNGERFVKVDFEQGQAASTRYELMNSYLQASLLKVWPQTGRTHQIRVHCASEGFPIVGDSKYTLDNNLPEAQPSKSFGQALGGRHFLHCAALDFSCVAGGLKLSKTCFEAPLPEPLEGFLKNLVKDELA